MAPYARTSFLALQVDLLDWQLEPLHLYVQIELERALQLLIKRYG